MSIFILICNFVGCLICWFFDGILYINVMLVWVFLLVVFDEGLVLMSQEGYEIVWIENLVNLDVINCSLIEEEFGSCEFMLEVCCIVDVSSFVMFSIWQIEISCGNMVLVLKGEEDICCLFDNGFLIVDNYGIFYLICDCKVFDCYSCKILECFLQFK